MKTFVKSFLLVFLMLTSFALFSQNDTILLKNGTTIIGDIIEKSSESSLKVRKLDGNFCDVNINFIEKHTGSFKIVSEKNKIEYENNKDTIFLKNETIIIGTIIQKNSNNSLKVKNSDNKFCEVKIDFIRGIRGENKSIIKIEEINDKPINVNDTALFNGLLVSLELAFNLNIPREYKYTKKKDWVGIKSIFGYAFNKSFFLGAGFGLDFYNSTGLIPLTAEMQISDTNNDKVFPFLNLSIGYTVSLDNDFTDLAIDNIKGGLIFNPTIGVKFLNENNSFLYFKLGYKSQSQVFNYTVKQVNNSFFGPLYSTKEISESVNFSYINLSAGFSF